MLVDPLHNLGNDEQLKSLTLTNASHSESSLSIISECHILAECNGSLSVDTLMDIHTSGMNLIIKREPTVNRYTSLGKSNDVHSVA